VSDLLLVQSFPNDTAAQVAAAALRDAGLHPVVFAHDPLAQLFTPLRAARLHVPAEELEAARELLGAVAEPPREGIEDVLRGPEFQALAASVWALAFLFFAAVAQPVWLLVFVLVSVGFWYWLRVDRRGDPEM